jgi:hypothetical protein
MGRAQAGHLFRIGREGARAGTIGFFSFATRQVTPLRRWEERDITVPAVAISADGRYLLTVQTDQQVNDLMMIENLR